MIRVFIWTCRFCGSKCQVHCPSGIVEKAKLHLIETGCYFCQYTLYLELMAGSLIGK
jgi:hypothetical protein